MTKHEIDAEVAKAWLGLTQDGQCKSLFVLWNTAYTLGRVEASPIPLTVEELAQKVAHYREYVDELIYGVRASARCQEAELWAVWDNGIQYCGVAHVPLQTIKDDIRKEEGQKLRELKTGRW